MTIKAARDMTMYIQAMCEVWWTKYKRKRPYRYEAFACICAIYAALFPEGKMCLDGLLLLTRLITKSVRP